MAYWLMKSEPDTFSIDDLARRPGKTEPWDGVRNYQARNHMRAMAVGDQVFFYHSSCAEPAIVGTMRVCADAAPDAAQFDPKSPYYDPASKPDAPRWFAVKVRYERTLKKPLTLSALRLHADKLPGFQLLMRGSRLSVLPVSDEHWDYIMNLTRAKDTL